MIVVKILFALKIIVTVILSLNILLFASFLFWDKKDEDFKKVFVIFGLLIIGMALAVLFMWW